MIEYATTVSQRQLLAEMKALHDKPANRVVREGKTICRACGYDWDRYTHGC